MLLALKFWLILKISLKYILLSGYSNFSADISEYRALMNWSVSCNMWSNLHWSKFSSTDHKSGHVLVYCDFNLQRWSAATSLALISNLKTICFAEVYFKAKIMGESFKICLEIFKNNLKIANFTKFLLSSADLETLVWKSLWCDTFIPIVLCVRWKIKKRFASGLRPCFDEVSGTEHQLLILSLQLKKKPYNASSLVCTFTPEDQSAFSALLFKLVGEHQLRFRNSGKSNLNY